MRSVSDHQAAVAALFGPPESVRIPVPDALGMVTASDVVAAAALPGFDNSAMDGYAVRAADIAGASDRTPVSLPVTEDIPAGRTDHLILEPGTAHRIMTGAPMPDGADTVVPVEMTDASMTASPPPPGATRAGALPAVAVRAALPVGRHVRRAGSDIAAGERALPAGTALRAPHLGLLAALGLAEVTVWRRRRVAVLSTGSELVGAGTALRHGQIYESNGVMLTAAATEAGASATHLHFVPDDADHLLRRLHGIADDADLIVTSGGVSAGAFEVVKEALSATGGVEFVKVAMQPGMPQGSGHLTSPSGRRVPVITLPGNPVSALVSFEVFIRPPLRRAMGRTDQRRRLSARLRSPISSPTGKRQFMRGVLTVDGPDGPGDAADVRRSDHGDPRDTAVTVDPIGPPSSHHLRYLAAADVLIDIPVAVEQIAAGEVVDVLVL